MNPFSSGEGAIYVLVKVFFQFNSLLGELQLSQGAELKVKITL